MQNPIINKSVTVLLVSMLLISAKAFAGTANYSATTNIFENPERGFDDLISNSESFLNPVSAHPVARVNVRLDRFKNIANLDSCFLSNLAASFAAVRSAGIKVRLTFIYNFGVNPTSCYTPCNGGPTVCSDGADAPLSKILGHIAQLGPTLSANSDVIYGIDAGFIGWFGEWHDSTNGNDTISAHNSVITAERNNFPVNRIITVRRPAYKLNYLGCNCPGSYTWLGHHNQKFVDDSDAQLFNDPQGVWSSSDCRAFYSNDVSFTANGADASEGAGLIDGNTALTRMQNYHYTILTAYPGLISYWQTNYPTQYSTMQQKLGYRFQVTQATTPTTPVIRGQTYTISVNLKNNGFSKLMNRREMYALFIHWPSFYVAPATFKDSSLSDDLRDLTLAAGTKTYTTTFALPANFATGTASTYLWLPDHSNINGVLGTGLQADPRYSARVDGNPTTWSSNLGATLLGNSANNIQVQ